MATVRDVAEEALADLGVLGAGEVASAGDATLALRKLNGLLDQWAAERLMIYTTTRTTWTIVSGTQNYTVGTGGDVNIARPVSIEGVRYQDTSTSPTVEYPLGDLLTQDEWEGIATKTLTSNQPTRAYYNPTYPLGTLSFWPVPTSSTLQGVIYVPTAVTQFAAITDSFALPPAYKRMVVKNLAVELASSFEREPSRTLVAAAGHSMRVVKRQNFPLKTLGFEFVGDKLSGYDIRVDQ